jgi:PEP-CTERM motif-containing protein
MDHMGLATSFRGGKRMQSSNFGRQMLRAAAGVLLLSASVQAAGTVSISPPQSASSQGFNLTSLGQADWLKWAGSSASQVNEKATGNGAIGSFIRTDSNSFPTDFDNTGTGNAHTGFSWSDGDASLPATAGNQIGAVMFDPDISGSTAGTGFQFTAFPGAGSGRLRFWGMSFGADTALYVTLKNASNATIATASNFGFTNPGGIFGPNYASAYFDIPFTGVQNGDKLVVQYTETSDNGDDVDGHGYIGLMAAALNVTPAPEPGSMALLAVAGFGLLGRRRRA